MGKAISFNGSDPDTAKNQFAVILSMAVFSDLNLGAFIKSKTLKQIDNDYDVIYHFVENKSVANGKTFRDLI